MKLLISRFWTLYIVSQSVVLHVSVNMTDFKVLDIVYVSQYVVHSLLVSVNVIQYR